MSQAPAGVDGPFATRLLGDLAAGPGRIDLAAHTALHGPMPATRGGRGSDDDVVRVVEASGLVGRGGAGFPTGRKLRTVAAGRRPVVVANGAEGEPASGKDLLLLTRTPHLVLDGLDVAARAVGSTARHVAVHRGSPAAASIRAALAERSQTGDVQVHELPSRYVSSEGSALVAWLNGMPAKPTFAPPHSYERGVAGRPTLVNNVETLAHLALVARHGAAWYRELGDPAEPGTILLTVTLPSGRQVVETPTSTTIGTVLEALGVTPDRCSAVLVGGYFGTWLAREQVWALPLTHYALRGAGGSLGAGILVPIDGDTVCGLAETARITRYLADQNAGQCGPCFNGLPAVALAIEHLAFAGRAEPALNRWLGIIPGRGACAHPDGATRMVASALATFAAHAQAHLAGGPCPAAAAAGLLPIPHPDDDWR